MKLPIANQTSPNFYRLEAFKKTESKS